MAPLETKSELKMNCETGSYVSHRQTEWERHTEDSFCLCLHEESDVGLSNLFSCVSVRGCTGCVCARGCVWVCCRLRYEWSFGQHQRALTLTSLESSQESFSGFPNNGPSPQSDPVVPGRFHSELFGRFLSDSLSELVCHWVAFRNQMMWLYTVMLKQRLDL